MSLWETHREWGKCNNSVGECNNSVGECNDSANDTNLKSKSFEGRDPSGVHVYGKCSDDLVTDTTEH